MFKVTFRISLPQVEGVVTLGTCFSQHDDPYRALDEAKGKRADMAKALRQTMPMLKRIQEGDIEVSVKVHSPQLVLFVLPEMKRTEVLPGKAAYEMFLNDSAPTLSKP
jgi:hypothetical protein